MHLQIRDSGSRDTGGEEIVDEQKKPRSREKRVVSQGKGVQKTGQGLGTGPVNNTGNYEARRKQEQAAAQQDNRQTAHPFAQQPQQGANPFAQQRPQQSANPFAQRPQQGANPFAQRPRQGAGTQRPGNASQNRPQDAAGRAYRSAVKQSGGSGKSQNGTTRASGGGSGKLILIVVALALLLGGGRLGGLFGGGDQGSSQQVASNPVQNASGGLGDLLGGGSSSSGGGLGDLLGGGSSSSGGGLGDLLGGGSSGSLTNLLGSLMGSSGASSVYDTGDFSSLLSGLTGGSAQSSLPVGDAISSSVLNSNGSQYFTSSSSSASNTASVDTSVAGGAREKYTRILGNNRDEVTILVYMCGADLESQQGMATSDLKEMAAADIGDRVNLIVYTGGASRWRNNVVSARNNQIYQIKGGSMYRLEDNMGTGSMTSPDTLAEFIRYGRDNFSANRMCLIFWDHGGGSVSGYGYDERYGHNQTMTLAGINTALKKGGVQFDFVGFDTCLMATVENALMLSQYADYMIASEETEPGVGWYYTNWLTKLGRNTSMPTTQIGKLIVDDFVDVCNQKCRGQATTLSVTDLAELEATVPEDLKSFSIDTNELIQNKQYKTVASARSKTREFAQASRIDQVDLVHFASNMGTEEGKELARTLRSAVKYNRTGGGISNAYGLSIYFPYKKTSNVTKAVSTYKAIGMDEEYLRCIQEFASLELSGQVSAGTPLSGIGGSMSAYPGLMDSLLGGSSQGSGYSAAGLSDLLGGLFGGSAGSSAGAGGIMDLFMNRSMTAERASAYILENHFDADALVWQDGKITLTADQWGMVDSLNRNVFFDDGKGFIDLGTDNEFVTEGNSLVGEFDGTWMSINGQPVAYYYLDTVEEGDSYVISGYVPALLNGEQVNLILQFDNERPYGYIAGAEKVYKGAEQETQAKALIAIGSGDRVQFLCDYFDYNGNYLDSYTLGEEMILGQEQEIANTPVTEDLSRCRLTYCFTDYYQQPYWTPAFPLK